MLFLLALVPYLLDRGEVSIDEVAAHFDVPSELVRRSVELLPVTGIPGSANAYLDNDLFDIDYEALDEGNIVLTRNIVIDEAPRLSAREASALIAGLQYLSALPENAESGLIAGLMAKLARGASDTPGGVSVQRPAPDAALQAIRSAIDAGTQVRFEYLNGRDEREQRQVDPLRVESLDQDWYLRGWDHSRQALRTFRLDRMTATRATADAIAHETAGLKLPDALFEASADDLEVTVELPVDALGLLADYRPTGSEPGSREGLVRTTLRVAHHHGLKRLITGLGGVAVVISPPEARRRIAQWAAAGAATYQEQPDSAL
jgi:proteasome accessory factor C